MYLKKEFKKLNYLVFLSNNVVDVDCKFDIFNDEYDVIMMINYLNLLLLNYQLMHLSYLVS